MAMMWKPLSIAAGFLLFLTYLLFQSRSPDPTLPTRLHEALQACELYDAALTRDVLLARAGLLPHYDSLAQASRGLSQAREALRQGSETAAGEAARILGPPMETLATALRQNANLIEDFKADNALLRNSLLYVIHAGHTLRTRAVAAGQEAVAAEVGALSHTLLRYLQTPEWAIGTEITAILDRLPAAPPFPQDLHLLSTHGRLIVEVLPQVDGRLRELIAAPTTIHARALRDVALQYYRQVDARAQRFRVLLYGAAILLLGYLLSLFVRLRASEAQFRAITETASEAIISADRTGVIVSWNAGATAVFGYEAAEVLGTPLTRLIPVRDREAHAHAFARWAATGCARLIGTTAEFAGERKDGSVFPLELSLSTWTTAQGTYVTGIIRDLTARKRLEEQTRQQEI
jgi:PAS domain S-box-containing protein